jgi:hypothetical protein
MGCIGIHFKIFSFNLKIIKTTLDGDKHQHEFDGRAKATTYGYAIDAPSLRGDTGIGELGLILKPSKNLPLSFDLSVQGYVGKRDGVTGSLQVRFEF